MLWLVLVALLIGGFLVANAFSIMVAQRTRELALLRCLGATTGQVRNAVLLEALVVGVAASLLGTLAAVHHNSLLDNLSMLVALFAVSMPSFADR